MTPIEKIGAGKRFSSEAATNLYKQIQGYSASSMPIEEREMAIHGLVLACEPTQLWEGANMITGGKSGGLLNFASSNKKLDEYYANNGNYGESTRQWVC